MTGPVIGGISVSGGTSEVAGGGESSKHRRSAVKKDITKLAPSLLLYPNMQVAQQLQHRQMVPTFGRGKTVSAEHSCNLRQEAMDGDVSVTVDETKNAAVALVEEESYMDLIVTTIVSGLLIAGVLVL
jgi:hypothetical protein